MKKIVICAAILPALALAACGTTDDADAPAEADSVEMPADEVMAQPGMDADPAIDPAISEEMGVPTASAVPAPAETTASDAAEAADDAAADLSAAMADD